jgi:hypothetical protein
MLRLICPALHPLQTLLLAAFSTTQHAQQGRLSGVAAQHLLIPEGPLRRMSIALQKLGPMYVHQAMQEVPPFPLQQWLSSPGQQPRELVRVVSFLVWGSQRGQPLATALKLCKPLTVKAVTAMQLDRVVQLRVLQHQAYASQALESSNLAQPVREQQASAFCRGMHSVWKVPWENCHKETLWRLAVNGVQGSGGLNICHREPCACGYQLSEAQVRAGAGHLHRQHAYWDCLVAQAVVQQLQQGLGGRQLSQWHVWLLQPPSGGGGEIQPAVWKVVGLAALEAMDLGRRYMWWRIKQGGVAAAVGLEEAKTRASSAFWLALHDFARDGRLVPSKGWGAVGADHPFLSVLLRVPLVPRLCVVVPVV